VLPSTRVVRKFCTNAKNPGRNVSSELRMRTFFCEAAAVWRLNATEIISSASGRVRLETSPVNDLLLVGARVMAQAQQHLLATNSASALSESAALGRLAAQIQSWSQTGRGHPPGRYSARPHEGPPGSRESSKSRFGWSLQPKRPASSPRYL